jgi:hypothetical protein
MKVQLKESLKSMKYQLREFHNLIDVASQPHIPNDDNNSEYHVVEQIGALQASLNLASRRLSVLLDRRNETVPNNSVSSGTKFSESEEKPTSSSQGFRHATVEESTDAEAGDPPSDTTPQPEDFVPEHLPTPSNAQSGHPEPSPRKSSKRPRDTNSSDRNAITGKRRHDGNGTLPPWPKKSKEKHTISHFGVEAEFLPEPQFYDLTEEVDRRLKLREEMKEKEKARLADKSKKRRKSSTDVDVDSTSILFKSVVVESVQVGTSRKKMRTGSPRSSEEEL